MASDGAADNRFGTAVALAGDLAVVGAFGTDWSRGAAYIFAGTEGTWTETARLVASDGASFDWFGAAVAAAGDTVVVGAELANVDQRLKLTISSAVSVGLNLQLGSNAFLRGTRFIGTP